MSVCRNAHEKGMPRSHMCKTQCMRVYLCGHKPCLHMGYASCLGCASCLDAPLSRPSKQSQHHGEALEADRPTEKKPARVVKLVRHGKEKFQVTHSGIYIDIFDDLPSTLRARAKAALRAKAAWQAKAALRANAKAKGGRFCFQVL